MGTTIARVGLWLEWRNRSHVASRRSRKTRYDSVLAIATTRQVESRDRLLLQPASGYANTRAYLPPPVP